MCILVFKESLADDDHIAYPFIQVHKALSVNICLDHCFSTSRGWAHTELVERVTENQSVLQVLSC